MVFALAVLLAAAASAGPAQADKGELKIEGMHIFSLILQRQDGLVRQWTNPEGSMQMPAGTYRVQRVEIQGGYVCTGANLGDPPPLIVSPDKPAILKAGGPLRQAVRAERQGSMLVLNYELVGIGDEKYRPVATAQGPPSFTIYKGGKAIASGQFEFG